MHMRSLVRAGGLAEPSSLLRLAGVAAVYFAMGKLGLALSFGHRVATPIWPPTGLALAAAMLWGWRVCPGIMAGAFLVNFTTLLRSTGHPLESGWVSLAIASGNTLEAFGGAWLVERYARGRAAFQQPQTVLLFVVLAALGATAVSASIGVGASTLAGVEPATPASQVWFTWWLGDMASAILLTPLIIVWRTDRWPQSGLKRVREAVLLAVFLAVSCFVVFGKWLPDQTHFMSRSFLIIPALLWAALRFGQRGTTLATFLLAVIGIFSAIWGSGRFPLAGMDGSLLLLQNFLMVVAVMSLMLAADVAQRQRVDAGLRTSEQRYRDLFEASPQPMWVYDYETLHFLAVNRAAINRYGYTREEFLARRITDIRPPEDVPTLLEDVAKGRAGLEISTQRRHFKKDGTLIEVETSRRNLVFDGRSAALVLCTDVTERKKTERRMASFSDLGCRLSAARTPKEAAEIILETANSLFGWDACTLNLCLRDPQKLERVCCVDTLDGRRTEETLPYALAGPLTRRTLTHGAQLILRPTPAAFPPDSAPFGNRSRPSASLMFVPVRKEAQNIGVLSVQSYTPNAYTEKDLRLLQALADHVGGALERIRAEREIERLNAELRKRVEELQSLFEVAPVGIAVAHDPECHVITINRAGAAMLATNGTENVSKSGPDAQDLPYKVMFAGKEIAPEDLPMQRAARGEGLIRGQEMDVVFADGRVVNSLISASPLYDEAGHVRGSLGVFVDLTRRKQAEAAAQESNERLRLALAAGKMGTWIIEWRQPMQILPSPEVTAMFGLKPEEVTGTEVQLFSLIHPDDHAACREALTRAFAGQGEYEIEFRILPPNRPLGWILARGQAYRDARNQPVRLAGIVIDITERKLAEEEVLRLNSDLERRVRQRTAQLEATNKELESFSYSVSHDLRAPLRSIRGFSEMLLQRYRGKLDDRGGEFLRRASESADRMDALIEDLLKLSRVGRGDLRFQTVDLSQMAKNIMAELRQAEPKRAVKLSIAPGLHAAGDERLLHVMFENLLRNAWKFTAKQPKARIEFGVTDGPASAYFVRDNGAGFDRAHADKLFGAFQRLHSESEFPGTGVGLATVQRIINRHGGRVWAEGAVGQGATFYFTLPAHEE
jgi:PAS domain S-box-containing protein